MSIDKLKSKFFNGSFINDVKHYFSKINEIIDYLNDNPISGSGLSGLTTNKVLKATSSTTAGDSNITDDGTTVSINKKTTILQNTVGTGTKGLSVNFNTIGEVFYIDDNGYLVYIGGGATVKGSNGLLEVISNGGVEPRINFKYNNGSNISGEIYGASGSLIINTPVLNINAPSVTKNGVEVATVNDILGGATGSFTTNDGKTITVTNGRITAIV